LVLETANTNGCRDTKSDLLTLPSGMFEASQDEVEMLASNLQLKSTSNVFQNTSNQMQKLKSVDLSSNFLEELHPDEFSSAVGLKELKISNNQLRYIGEKTFKNLGNLVHLDLSVNRINMLATNTISSLTNLETLYLHNNQLTVLDVNLFSSTRKLTDLFLEMNSIATIQPSNITTSVKVLMLHKNQLTDISNLKNFGNLIKLRLDSNTNLNINSTSFATMKSLEYLWLDNIDLQESERLAEALKPFKATLRELSITNNNLKKLEISKFPILSDLVTLRIDGNKLSTIDHKQIENKMPILRHIKIGRNDWSCENLKKMIETLNTTKIEILDARSYGDINVDGISCHSEKLINIYTYILIGLGVVVVIIAFCLFLAQFFIKKKSSGNVRSPEQKPFVK
jgi:Leucine-rich repeat (LRR) protein